MVTIVRTIRSGSGNGYKEDIMWYTKGIRNKMKKFK